MSILRKKHNISEEDVEMLKSMMKQFDCLHKGAGMPDYSIEYVGYFPVFALAFLASQESVDKLTKILIGLTVVIAVLTGVLCYVTIIH